MSENRAELAIIADTADLLDYLGAADVDSIADVIEDRLFDPVAWVEVETDRDGFCAAGYGYRGEDQYAFELRYPVSIPDLERELDGIEQHFLYHSKAQLIGPGPIGDPTCEDDVTDELADLAALTRDEVVDLLSGRWDPVTGLPDQGADGDRICRWYLSNATPHVALGVGGATLFVEPARLDDTGAWDVADAYPVPAARWAWASDHDLEPQAYVHSLREILATRRRTAWAVDASLWPGLGQVTDSRGFLQLELLQRCPGAVALAAAAPTCARCSARAGTAHVTDSHEATRQTAIPAQADAQVNPRQRDPLRSHHTRSSKGMFGWGESAPHSTHCQSLAYPRSLMKRS